MHVRYRKEFPGDVRIKCKSPSLATAAAVGHTARLGRAPSPRIFVFTHVFGFFDNPITYRSSVLSFGRHPCFGTCAPNFSYTAPDHRYRVLGGADWWWEETSFATRVRLSYRFRRVSTAKLYLAPKTARAVCKANRAGYVSYPTDALQALWARPLDFEICKRPRATTWSIPAHHSWLQVPSRTNRRFSVRVYKGCLVGSVAG